MTNPTPLVTVFIPSYQHARFVGTAIQSVLEQSYKNIELIISDDGSTDGSQQVILEYSKDPRVKISLLEKNSMGEHNNTVFDFYSGEFFCILNSDDYWEIDKLEKQVAFLCNNPHVGIVFSEAREVDETRKQLSKCLFRAKNFSSACWLRYFFTNPNCLCTPSAMVRRSVYESVGRFHLTLSQLPDFDFWIRALKQTEIYILPEVLTNFRHIGKNNNASADTHRNMRKYKNEWYLILKHYFDDMDFSTFAEGFSDSFICKNAKTESEFRCEQAFLFLRVDTPLSLFYHLIGIEKLYDLMEHSETKTILEEQYHFTRKDFWALMGDYDGMTGLLTSQESLHTLYRYSIAGARRIAKIFRRRDKLPKLLHIHQMGDNDFS